MESEAHGRKLLDDGQAWRNLGNVWCNSKEGPVDMKRTAGGAKSIWPWPSHKHLPSPLLTAVCTILSSVHASETLTLISLHRNVDFACYIAQLLIDQMSCGAFCVLVSQSQCLKVSLHAPNYFNIFEVEILRAPMFVSRWMVAHHTCSNEGRCTFQVA